MLHKTPLHQQHLDAHGRMAAFCGWELPLHFGSQIEEHHAVRRDAGMFDVSHMTLTDLAGAGARDLLGRVLANDVGRLRPGQAAYGCLLNERAGIVDDAIVYRVDSDSYRLVSNAATRERVRAWLLWHAQGCAVNLVPRDDLAMIAVQGPAARTKAAACLPPALCRDAAGLASFESASSGDWQVACTGYTGEDGYEVMLPRADVPGFWQCLEGAGVRPCGLGARDTLRLEAGMRLYGTDMDETLTPLDAGLLWTVAWQPEDRHFVGRDALSKRRLEGESVRFAGLVLEGPGVLRQHQKVRIEGLGEGTVTSGGFSPTLGRGIALARLPPGAYGRCQVQVRETWREARVVKPCFVKLGQSLVDGIDAIR